MIDVSDQRLYVEALARLNAFKRNTPSYKGRFVQIFLALKFYQSDIPSIFSGAFLSTEVFQTMLDDLYAKARRALNDCVLSLFENTHMARTGLVRPGNTGAQNTWRNNFNLQKGIGCYATPQDLTSPTFLDQSRLDCRYLSPSTPGVLAGATCSLCPTSAQYRNEAHRKWLRIDPGGNGYAALDPYNVNNFLPYVAPNGARVPALPLSIALYHDATPALILGTRQAIDLNDFRDDFNFTTDEFVSYFDDDPANAFNSALLHAFPTVSYNRITGAPAPAALRQAPVRPRPGRRQGPTPIPVPVLTGTPSPPPVTNTGWAAEQFVASALATAGWNVHDVSRQQVGFDLLAHEGRTTLYVEVKSSVGSCTPNLTLREWQQAQTHGGTYVLAIIEYFNPLSTNTIYWIPDPTRACVSRQCQAVVYMIPRSSWITATVGIDDLCI